MAFSVTEAPWLAEKVHLATSGTLTLSESTKKTDGLQEYIRNDDDHAEEEDDSDNDSDDNDGRDDRDFTDKSRITGKKQQPHTIGNDYKEEVKMKTVAEPGRRDDFDEGRQEDGTSTWHDNRRHGGKTHVSSSTGEIPSTSKEDEMQTDLPGKRSQMLGTEEPTLAQTSADLETVELGDFEISDQCKPNCPRRISKKRRIRRLEETQRRVDVYLLNKGSKYFDDVCTCSLACVVRALRDDPFVRSVFSSIALFTLGLKLCAELNAWYLHPRQFTP